MSGSIGSFAALAAWQPVIGVDPHEVTVPFPPFEMILPYVTLHIMGGTFYGLPVVGSSLSQRNMTLMGPFVQQGSDVGWLHPHIGFPSISLILIWIFSSSTSPFGASTVLVEDNPAGAALMVYVGLNVNCGDPISFPTGFPIAYNTTMVGMSLGDLLSGFLDIFMSMAMDGAMIGIGKLAGKAKKVIKKKFSTTIAKRTGKQIQQLKTQQKKMMSRAKRQTLNKKLEKLEKKYVSADDLEKFDQIKKFSEKLEFDRKVIDYKLSKTEKHTFEEMNLKFERDGLSELQNITKDKIEAIRPNYFRGNIIPENVWKFMNKEDTGLDILKTIGKEGMSIGRDIAYNNAFESCFGYPPPGLHDLIVVPARTAIDGPLPKTP